MARTGGKKCLLNTLNGVFIVLGLALAATALWFFVQVLEFTSLRNKNHYLLDYNVYWPQIVPWMFFLLAMFGVGVAAFGIAATKKNNSRMLLVYSGCQGLLLVLLLGAAIIALIFADTKATNDFVRDTVWDAYFQSKTDVETEAAFGNIEKKLQCCGAEGPRDYKNWKNEFPRSCCDVYYHGFYGSYAIDCDFTNKLANERYGCATVASEYARIVTKVFAGVSIFIGFLGVIALSVAVSLSRAVKQKPRIIAAQRESESKKVLL